MDTVRHQPLRDILSHDNELFSGEAYRDILLFNVVSINPQRRPSDDHRVLAQAASKKDGLAACETRRTRVSFNKDPGGIEDS